MKIGEEETEKERPKAVMRSSLVYQEGRKKEKRTKKKKMILHFKA